MTSPCNSSPPPDLLINGDSLRLTPRVRRAWHDAVNAHRRGEPPSPTTTATTSADGENPACKSIVDDVKEWWRRRRARQQQPQQQLPAFDRGAVIDDEGGGSGGVGGGGGAAEEPEHAPLPTAAEIEAQEGGAVMDSNSSSSSSSSSADVLKALVGLEKETSCVVCLETPRHRSCFLPCGHASICYSCSLQSAIALSGACPLCRTRAIAIVTYEFVQEEVEDEHEAVRAQQTVEANLRAKRSAPAAGKGGIKAATAADESAAATNEKEREEPAEKKDQSQEEALEDEARDAGGGGGGGGVGVGEGGGGGGGGGERSSSAVIWIAKVTGPSGPLLNYLTEDDLSRIS